MDRNVIQAPELARRVTRRLGVREAHIVSTLNEGLQAVVIVDDLSRDQVDAGAEPIRFAMYADTPVNVAAQEVGAMLFNASSDRYYRVQRLTARLASGSSSSIPLVLGWRDAGTGGFSQILNTMPSVDRRRSPVLAASGIQSWQIGPTAGLTAYTWRIANGVFTLTQAPLDLGPEWGLVIGPGLGLVLQTAQGAGGTGTQSFTLSAVVDEVKV